MQQLDEPAGATGERAVAPLAERNRQIQPHHSPECDEAGKKDRRKPEREAQRDGHAFQTGVFQTGSVRSV